jgi:hypothetical protein
LSLDSSSAGGAQVRTTQTIEVKGGDQPACVAQAVAVFYE